MIPAGVIPISSSLVWLVAVYIAARLVEILAKPDSAFMSPTASVLAKIGAGLGLVVGFAAAVDMAVSGGALR